MTLLKRQGSLALPDYAGYIIIATICGLILGIILSIAFIYWRGVLRKLRNERATAASGSIEIPSKSFLVLPNIQSHSLVDLVNDEVKRRNSTQLLGESSRAQEKEETNLEEVALPDDLDNLNDIKALDPKTICTISDEESVEESVLASFMGTDYDNGSSVSIMETASDNANGPSVPIMETASDNANGPSGPIMNGNDATEINQRLVIKTVTLCKSHSASETFDDAIHTSFTFVESPLRKRDYSFSSARTDPEELSGSNDDSPLSLIQSYARR